MARLAGIVMLIKKGDMPPYSLSISWRFPGADRFLKEDGALVLWYRVSKWWWTKSDAKWVLRLYNYSRSKVMIKMMNDDVDDEESVAWNGCLRWGISQGSEVRLPKCWLDDHLCNCWWSHLWLELWKRKRVEMFRETCPIKVTPEEHSFVNF